MTVSCQYLSAAKVKALDFRHKEAHIVKTSFTIIVQKCGSCTRRVFPPPLQWRNATSSGAVYVSHWCPSPLPQSLLFSFYPAVSLFLLFLASLELFRGLAFGKYFRCNFSPPVNKCCDRRQAGERLKPDQRRKKTHTLGFLPRRLSKSLCRCLFIVRPCSCPYITVRVAAADKNMYNKKKGQQSLKKCGEQQQHKNLDELGRIKLFVPDQNHQSSSRGELQNHQSRLQRRGTVNYSYFSPNLLFSIQVVK